MWCLEIFRILDSAVMSLYPQILKVSSLHFMCPLGQPCILYYIHHISKKKVAEIKRLFPTLLQANINNTTLGQILFSVQS